MYRNSKECHKSGREARSEPGSFIWDRTRLTGMVNSREPLIIAVTANESKKLTDSSQKARAGKSPRNWDCTDIQAHGV